MERGQFLLAYVQIGTLAQLMHNCSYETLSVDCAHFTAETIIESWTEGFTGNRVAARVKTYGDVLRNTNIIPAQRAPMQEGGPAVSKPLVCYADDTSAPLALST